MFCTFLGFFMPLNQKIAFFVIQMSAYAELGVLGLFLLDASILVSFGSRMSIKI